MSAVQRPSGLDAGAGRDRFGELFDGAPDGAWFAPGRVNLIGEHTDYNDGFVLPAALSQGALAQARRRPDRTLRLHSINADETTTLDLDDIRPGADLGWAAYLAGVGWAAAQRGLDVPGLDLVVTSDVPLGAGLSSSAALSCVVARAWTDLAGWDLPDTEVAALGRTAENEIAGAPTGLMDQLASVCGRKDHVLQIDTRSQEVTAVACDLSGRGTALLVIDSQTPHALVDGAYGDRRAECREAADRLGVRALRDVDLAGLSDALAELPELLARRARHVVTDSARVQQVVDLLREDADPRSIGPLLNASHASMRDDFAITVPTVDVLQEAAVEAGAHGARMTGGGFGGCVIALVDLDRVEQVAAACVRAARTAGHPRPTAFVAEFGPGARRLST